ncbi:MAG: hypothetical protein V4487_02975 [Chlamydiota bacterium]
MGSNIRPFPPDARRFAGLDAKLASGDLSLGEIQEIGEELSISTTSEKISECSQRFLKLEEKKSAWMNRQIALISEVNALSQQIEELEIQWNYLPPDEIAEKLLALQERASVISADDASPRVQKICIEAKKQLEILHFEFVFPLAKELNCHSLEPTFASRLEHIAARMRKEHSLNAFQSLDPLQQRQILAFNGRSS